MKTVDTPGASPVTLPIEIVRALSALLPSPVPIAEWASAVTALYATRRRTTRIRMGQALRELAALAGPGATTAELTPALVARYGSYRPDRRKATADGLLAAVRAACRVAADRRWIGPTQLAGASWTVLRPEETPRRKHHTPAEVGRVLAHLARDAGSWEGGRLHALACVLAYAGLRKMEALHLRAEDVDLRGGFLRVRPNGRPLKTRSSAATVPMPDRLVEVLRAWLPRCGSPWLFPGATRKGPWTGGSKGRRAADRLRAAGEAVGVPGFTPHTLRHSLATTLAARGVSDRQVRQVLRHAPGTVALEHYVHRDLAALRERVRRLDFGPTPRPRPSPRRPRPSHRRGWMLQRATSKLRHACVG